MRRVNERGEDSSNGGKVFIIAEFGKKYALLDKLIVLSEIILHKLKLKTSKISQIFIF